MTPNDYVNHEAIRASSNSDLLWLAVYGGPAAAVSAARDELDARGVDWESGQTDRDYEIASADVVLPLSRAEAQHLEAILDAALALGLYDPQGRRDALLTRLRYLLAPPSAAPMDGASAPDEVDQVASGPIPVGAHVRLKHDVERYPHFIAPAGATGIVVDTGDPQVFAVRLDEYLRGAEEWTNEVQWPDSYGDPADDLEVIPTRIWTVDFDVTGMTEREFTNFTGYVETQTEGESDGDDDSTYPSCRIVRQSLAPAFPTEPRTILVHLNVELPADAPATADDVEAEVKRALDNARGLSSWPALTVAEIDIPLAEEV